MLDSNHISVNEFLCKNKSEARKKGQNLICLRNFSVKKCINIVDIRISHFK